MNAIAKKLLLISFLLLLSACIHNPQPYGNYPGNGGYSSGHTVIQRNYYDNGYRSGPAYFPHQDRHEQSYAPHHSGNAYSGHQQGRGNDHQSNGQNNRRHDDNGDSRHNKFDRRNHN